MTALLVRAEASLGRGHEIQAQLKAWREPLERSGVVLVTAPPRDARCTAVVVVREQLDHLNATYCARVVDLQIHADFESFVTKAVASKHYDLMVEHRPLLDAPEVDLVAVPYSRLDGAAPARTILLAAGLAPGVVDALPAPAIESAHDDGDHLAGPVLVTAARLLHKRLARLGLVGRKDADDLDAAAARLQRRAEKSGWDDTAYWGWAPNLQTEAVEHFRPGNAAFAQRVWGGEWVDAAQQRDATKLDLASQRPAVVSDVITTIQKIVDTLRPADDISSGKS